MRFSGLSACSPGVMVVVNAVAGSAVVLAGNDAPSTPAQVDARLQQASRATLINALDLKGSWVSVHAAEALISLGQMDEVRQAFEPQSETSESKYRVGVWRVLARSAPDATTYDQYVKRVRQVLLQPDAVDRLHAVETLAKLGVALDGDERRVVQQMASSDVDADVPFAVWCLHNSGDGAVALKRLPAMLKSTDPVARGRAAYSLWQMKLVTSETRSALEASLDVEPSDSAVRPTMIAALGGDRNLEQLIKGATSGARYLSAVSVADAPRSECLPVLLSITDEKDVDVQVALACAILRCQAVASK